MSSVIWHNLRLEEVVVETSTTRRFLFTVEEGKILPYQAGQFLVCDLPIGEKRLHRWRSYSLANAFQNNNPIEFCISYKPGGPASEFFFNQIQVGDLIKAKGPEGNFLMPTDQHAQLVMICTGTGMAPFRAMLQQMIHQSAFFESVHLIFGCRNSSDILYQSEWKSWISHIPNFKATICLSREKGPYPLLNSEIRFMNHYVHQAYLNDLEHGILKKEQSIFMLCGWQQMIDEALEKLFINQKIPREQIRLELFG